MRLHSCAPAEITILFFNELRGKAKSAARFHVKSHTKIGERLAKAGSLPRRWLKRERPSFLGVIR
jgi:hypothetical protein